MAVKFDTIFGANVGFEYLSKADFEEAGLPVNFAIMINLLFFRFTVTSFKDE